MPAAFVHVRRRLGCAAVGLALAFAAASAAAQVASNSPREAFTAFAINLNATAGAASSPLDIVIERWTTDAQRDHLMEIFKKGGPDELLSELRDQPRVGYMRTPDSLAYDLHYARELPGEDGGRRIVLATDRPIGFWEATNRPRSIDYPFTLIELRVDGQGRGEGKLSIATRLTLNGNVLTLENYQSQPVMLKNVRKK